MEMEQVDEMKYLGVISSEGNMEDIEGRIGSAVKNPCWCTDVKCGTRQSNKSQESKPHR